ncbi:hypothetical protein ERJ75_000861300 [Trypanosoma vivax]|nr:hypothetical protein ERJ75_000861300 [Trypanosoma vivax]
MSTPTEAKRALLHCLRFVVTHCALLEAGDRGADAACVRAAVRAGEQYDGAMRDAVTCLAHTLEHEQVVSVTRLICARGISDHCLSPARHCHSSGLDSRSRAATAVCCAHASNVGESGRH